MRQKISKGKPPQRGGASQLRIIGGQWRSRRLPILNASGLRPTPDRVRETLFNWLQFEVQGSRCLDLFAGSGALGLEACSRGANEIILVEKDKKVAQQLQSNLQQLNADLANIKIINDDALRYLEREKEPFDIIFLDPPFRKQLLPNILDIIQTQQLLKSGGWLYLEFEQTLELSLEQWGITIHRETQAGDVKCLLGKMSIS